MNLFIRMIQIFSFIATGIIILYIMYGVGMMIGNLLGIVRFNNQPLVIGFAMVLLSSLIKYQKLNSITFMIGVILIVMN